MGEKNWMNKVVFFKDIEKLSEALSYFDMSLFKGESVLVKLHMGEVKNKFFIRPSFVREVIQELLHVGSSPFLYDTTVLYNSPRKLISGYKKVASLHGFNNRKIGCPVEIDDEGIDVEIEGNNFEVGKTLNHQSHIVCLSHVKGHIATGMGGAIKNFGMGGVTRNTKKMMHDGSKPIFINEACKYCGICAEVCPFNAIKVGNDSWEVIPHSCFGCGVCVENCPHDALSFVKDNLQYLLVCSTKACVENKLVLYINDINRIADSCDCDSFAKNILCEDIGYCVSMDPVAVDHASLKLIDEVKKDVFQKTHRVDPYKQIRFGEQIGLGSIDYKLIKL